MVETWNKEKIQQKLSLEEDYALFVKKREKFDDTDKIHCVFCPNGTLHSVSGYIFHVAREHMFDQYKNQSNVSESIKVGMFFKVLEEKARKELNSEIKTLQNKVEELKGKNFHYE